MSNYRQGNDLSRFFNRLLLLAALALPAFLFMVAPAQAQGGTVRGRATITIQGRVTEVRPRLLLAEVTFSGITAEGLPISGRGVMRAQGERLKGDAFRMTRGHVRFQGEIGSGADALPVRGHGRLSFQGDTMEGSDIFMLPDVEMSYQGDYQEGSDI